MDRSGLVCNKISEKIAEDWIWAIFHGFFYSLFRS